MRRTFWALLGLALLGMLLPASQAAAQAGTRCFPETGYCISGSVRSYWERNGGLSVFGYPITPLQTETVEGSWTGPVQWFERDRLEDHSAEGQGVLAGRLGALRLEQQGRPWRYGNATQQVPGCALFAPTGYQACGSFLTYWQRNGGLERFGYPITDVIDETIGARSYRVQYFERRRMELHAENAGTPYEVLLGLLGNEVRANTHGEGTCSVAVLPELQYNHQDFTADSRLGCPIAGQDYSRVAASAARFERGQMYWVQGRGGQGVIYAIIYGPNNTLTYRRFDDTWREGDAETVGLTPPAGLYEPRRGFGKVWREQAGIRDALGWALETERAERASHQVFEQGALLQIETEQLTWQFFGNGAARNARTRYY